MYIIHDKLTCTISLNHCEVQAPIFEVRYLTEHDAAAMIDFLLLFAQLSFLT